MNLEVKTDQYLGFIAGCGGHRPKRHSLSLFLLCIFARPATVMKLTILSSFRESQENEE
jgi:hypothetical protein